ncbi:carbohydrate ABC transporter permease [Halalkalibacterium halodurans]|uniref:carbohydrate ABC transporter permease n=1 Tax=Halalkalibacterium halodurans TaxID=86665 RepID=UPI002AAA0B3C|nr:carbohydrate ABC transporter permease [Halalkalibacterium halodurans]MDY7223288.1 carbohydrate ABC transporter permease [Halalkalibacterium halodurans]MDY7242509.1 carbohydrate ABC transporter permease [Halalkalibacterium halodurans]
MKSIFNYKLVIHLFFICFTAAFVIPFVYAISISLSSDETLRASGYPLIPPEIDFSAYQIVFNNMEQILRAYGVTTFTTFVGTFLSVLVMSLCAYPLSRPDVKWRYPVTFIIFLTMIFGGGLIPTYVLITQYYGLGNSIWVYIFPTLANAFHIIIFRTFFMGLPFSLIESAKLDGASEWKIFLKIVLPLSAPVIATIGLFNLLGRWNEWMTALIYIRDPDLYTLQFLLQRILMEVEFLNKVARELPIELGVMAVPTESVRFAMAIVSAGPMLFVFPFFQKYFAKGLTIGGVKG